MMTHKFRRLLIVGIWALLTVAVWFLIPQPSADDDEFPKWFAVAVLEFGAPWFLSLSVALLIALSLEQRFGRMRLRILSVWTLILVCLIGLQVFRPASFGRFDTRHTYRYWLMIGFQVFAMRELLPMLSALCVALWLEAKVSGRQLAPKSANNAPSLQ
jgi:hypothetical protein